MAPCAVKAEEKDLPLNLLNSMQKHIKYQILYFYDTYVYNSLSAGYLMNMSRWLSDLVNLYISGCIV